MSITAELGRGGGAGQAETNTGINKGQKQCMLEGLGEHAFWKSTDYRIALNVNALLLE